MLIIAQTLVLNRIKAVRTRLDFFANWSINQSL